MLFKSEICVGKNPFFVCVYEWLEIVLKKLMIHLACDFMCVRMHAYVCVCVCLFVANQLLYWSSHFKEKMKTIHNLGVYVFIFLLLIFPLEPKITSKWIIFYESGIHIRSLCAYHSPIIWICIGFYLHIWLLFYHTANTWNHKID